MKEIIKRIFDEVAKSMELTTTFNYEEDFTLLDGETDSLFFAMVVARMEEETGLDPFSENDEAIYPTTFNEFVALYEQAGSTE